MMLIFVPSVMKIFLNYRVDRIFVRKISKGSNSAKIVGGVTVLVLCTLFNSGLYLNYIS